MRRDFHLHPVSGTNPDKIHLRRPGGVGQNQVLILQPHPHDSARQKLNYLRLHCRGLAHGRVSTHGPFSVMATQCSKWAE